MIQTINFSKFCDGFTGSYAENFTYEAKKLLFEYFEDMEECSSEPTEFDPIAICCEYIEEDYEEIAKDNNLIHTNGDYSTKEEVIEFLKDNTIYIGESKHGMLVYTNF